MQSIQIQVVDHNIGSQWWISLFSLFLKEGDVFEIRCWNEERDEIAMAMSLGNSASQREGFETSITGKISSDMIRKMTALPEPKDKQNYNKMTPFFTIDIAPHFHSEHYGTEVFLSDLTSDEVTLVKNIIFPFPHSFSFAFIETE